MATLRPCTALKKCVAHLIVPALHPYHKCQTFAVPDVHGRLKPQTTSPPPAGCTVFPLHSQPLITTPRFAATTKPQHRGLLNTSCSFAAHASFWQTRRTPHRMLLGKNCRIAICTGPLPTGVHAVQRHCARTPSVVASRPQASRVVDMRCSRTAEAGFVAGVPHRRSSHALICPDQRLPRTSSRSYCNC